MPAVELKRLPSWSRAAGGALFRRAFSARVNRGARWKTASRSAACCVCGCTRPRGHRHAEGRRLVHCRASASTANGRRNSSSLSDRCLSVMSSSLAACRRSLGASACVTAARAKSAAARACARVAAVRGPSALDEGAGSAGEGEGRSPSMAASPASGYASASVAEGRDAPPARSGTARERIAPPCHCSCVRRAPWPAMVDAFAKGLQLLGHGEFVLAVSCIAFAARHARPPGRSSSAVFFGSAGGDVFGKATVNAAQIVVA